MNCAEVRQSIQDYVTRELKSDDRRLFDAHLVECAACQRELAVMTAVVSMLDHQPVLDPRPGLSERVMQSLPRQRVFLLSPWWSLVLAPVLAGLAWLFRDPIKDGIVGLLGRFGTSRIAVPAPTLQNVGVGAVAVVGLGLLVTAGAAAVCWRAYLRD